MTWLGPTAWMRQVAYLHDHPECVAVGSRALIIQAAHQLPKRVRSPEFVTLFCAATKSRRRDLHPHVG